MRVFGAGVLTGTLVHARGALEQSPTAVISQAHRPRGVKGIGRVSPESRRREITQPGHVKFGSSHSTGHPKAPDTVSGETFLLPPDEPRLGPHLVTSLRQSPELRATAFASTRAAVATGNVVETVLQHALAVQAAVGGLHDRNVSARANAHAAALLGSTRTTRARSGRSTVTLQPPFASITVQRPMGFLTAISTSCCGVRRGATD
jgi:hypothetical protein